MSVKIIVLDDGETWAGAGQILTITDEAHDKLCEGYDPSQLDDGDVLEVLNLTPNES